MSDLLSREEMTSLNRALAKRTDGRVRVGPKAITVAEGIAVWNCTLAFAPASARESVTIPLDPIRMLGTGGALVVAASLAGCATLGGNIKGSFACRAPDGICAPTSTIDDAALAMIGGEASAQPAGPYNAPASQTHLIPASAVEPTRSSEKVLRIVFPAHIDGAGRYRETTAIHAVVERGEWMAAGALQALPVRTSADVPANPPMEQLAMVSPPIRSLGELAAAAPEVQFPDPIADIDAQNEGAVTPAPIKMTTPVAALSAKPLSPRTERSVTGAAGTRVATSSRTAPQATAVPVAAASVSPIRYSLPPQTTVNPLDTIKAQVAARLNAGSSLSPTVRGSAVAPTTRGPGTAQPQPAKPANAPARFPASDVNP